MGYPGEAAALFDLLTQVIEADRFPFSSHIRTPRGIRAKPSGAMRGCPDPPSTKLTSIVRDCLPTVLGYSRDNDRIGSDGSKPIAAATSRYSNRSSRRSPSSYLAT